MARKARIKSSTGIYHVLVRAISDLSLFTDEEDTTYYTNILNDLQQQGRCEIYAYALFPTHVHLLIRAELNETAAGQRNEQSSTKQAEPYENSSEAVRSEAFRSEAIRSEAVRSEAFRSEAIRSEAIRSEAVRSEAIRSEAIRSEAIRSEAFRSEAIRSEAFRSDSVSYEPIGSIMKRLASSYSYFFNVKYDHYGPIYLDRFKSNPVESRDYFLKVLDHINSQDTQWKFTCRHIPSGLPNETVVGVRNEPNSTKQAKPYENESSSEAFRSDSDSYEVFRSASVSSSFPPLLEYRERSKRITDSRLLAYLQTNFQFTNIGEFLQREKEEQNEIIGNCKKLGGSIRQIVRLTGSPYQSVFQIK